MENKPSDHQREQKEAELYRSGYHHGFARAREILPRLLKDGMPPGVALELCRIFEVDIIVPWRMNGASSAPPVFDIEECQRLLRTEKERRSEKPS